MTRRLHCVCCWLATGLVAIHPFIHGTPLDSGALDSFLASLQAWVVTNGE